jgi:hypothetical protein
MSKKLRLDLDALNVDTFETNATPRSVGTVQGQMDAVVAGTIFSWCNTCDAGNATCGASCGSACVATKNTPDCWTKVTGGCYDSCWNYHCAVVAEPGEPMDPETV